MWKTYLSSREGVAIASTYQRLSDCFNSSCENVYIGKVNYLDYEKEHIDFGNVFLPYLSKRKSFEYERELRAMFWDSKAYTDLCHQYDAEREMWLSQPAVQPGKAIAVDLDTLVDAVYVAPTAPGWFHKLVDSVLKQYHLDKPVKQSDLAKDPVW